MDEDLSKRRGEELLGAENQSVKHTGEATEVEGDELAIRQLREGLESLERAVHVQTPNAAWFEHQIAAAKSKRRSRLLRDLLILWIGALLVFYVFYLTVTSRPVAFLSIQAAATLIPTAWLLFRKQETSHDNN